MVSQYLTRPDGARLSVRDYGNLLYFVFPNLLILVQPDHATAMIVLPQGTDACRIHGGALIPQPAETEKARAHWDRNVKIRSEEHTSELQSLMSISYAVFCLTKKKHNKQTDR